MLRTTLMSLFLVLLLSTAIGVATKGGAALLDSFQLRLGGLYSRTSPPQEGLTLKELFHKIKELENQLPPEKVQQDYLRSQLWKELQGEDIRGSAYIRSASGENYTILSPSAERGLSEIAFAEVTSLSPRQLSLLKKDQEANISCRVEGYSILGPWLHCERIGRKEP